MRPLFLDFDGVLHSDGVDSRHFEHAARLGELHERCGPVLGNRLFDVTPHMARRNIVDEDHLHLRFMEIATWLEGPNASPSGVMSTLEAARARRLDCD